MILVINPVSGETSIEISLRKVFCLGSKSVSVWTAKVVISPELRR